MHAWYDRKHILPKQKRKKIDTPLHPSVQAIFAYYEKTGKVPVAGQKKADLPLVQPKEVSPKELSVMLKKDFPRLYSEFGPTEAQIKHHKNQQPPQSLEEVDEPSVQDHEESVTQRARNNLGFGFCEGNSDSSSRSPTNVVETENNAANSEEKLVLQSSDSDDRSNIKDQISEQNSDG